MAKFKKSSCEFLSKYLFTNPIQERHNFNIQFIIHLSFDMFCRTLFLRIELTEIPYTFDDTHEGFTKMYMVMHRSYHWCIPIPNIDGLWFYSIGIVENHMLAWLQSWSTEQILSLDREKVYLVQRFEDPNDVQKSTGSLQQSIKYGIVEIS